MRVEHHGDETWVLDASGTHCLTFLDFGPDGCGDDHHYIAVTPDYRFRLHDIKGVGTRWVDYGSVPDGSEIQEEWEGENPSTWMYDRGLLEWTCDITNNFLPVRMEEVIKPAIC